MLYITSMTKKRARLAGTGEIREVSEVVQELEKGVGSEDSGVSIEPSPILRPNISIETNPSVLIPGVNYSPV